MANTPTAFPAVNPSDPPNTRTEARLDRSAASADRDLRMMIVASFTDWLGIVCLTVLIAMKALGPEFGWAIPALAGGTTIAKARGLKGVASTTALLLAAGPVVWKVAAVAFGRTVLAIALVFAVGCGSAGIPPNVLADARAELAKVAEPLREATPRLNRAGATLEAACVQPTPLLPPATCSELEGDFNAGADVLNQVQAALVKLDAALALLQAIESAQ